MATLIYLPNYVEYRLNQHCSSIDLDKIKTISPVWGGEDTNHTVQVRECRLYDLFFECMRYRTD